MKKDEFNERIRIIRNDLGLTQEQFGKPLGCDWFAIRDLESGKKRVTPKLIAEIEDIYSINSRWFLTGNGQMHLKPTPSKQSEKTSHGSAILCNAKDTATVEDFPLYPIKGFRLRQQLPEKEEAEYQMACQTLENDALVRKIVLTLGDMPMEKRSEVLSIAEEKKLLSQLMQERAAK